MLLAGRSAAGFSALLGGLCVVCSIRLLIAFQILFHALLRIADGVRQFDLRKIVGIKTLNVAFVSAGNCLLRLHDFQIIGYPGGEAILGLCERLFRQVDGTASHLDLLGGSVQIEQSCANLIVDTTAEISELGARLLQLRVRDQVFPLTLMEAGVLRYLIEREGKHVSRKAMLAEVWGLHEDTDTRAIDNFIVRLRRYIEDDPTRPRHLVTVRGVGYRFVQNPQ